jgi:hypothetical protein
MTPDLVLKAADQFRQEHPDTNSTTYAVNSFLWNREDRPVICGHIDTVGERERKAFIWSFEEQWQVGREALYLCGIYFEFNVEDGILPRAVGVSDELLDKPKTKLVVAPKSDYTEALVKRFHVLYPDKKDSGNRDIVVMWDADHHEHVLCGTQYYEGEQGPMELVYFAKSDNLAVGLWAANFCAKLTTGDHDSE